MSIAERMSRADSNGGRVPGVFGLGMVVVKSSPVLQDPVTFRLPKREASLQVGTDKGFLLLILGQAINAPTSGIGPRILFLIGPRPERGLPE